MRRIVFSPRAQRDLQEAWEHIAADNLTAADHLVDHIQRAVQLLGQMPGIGHARPDVSNARYRFWTVRPYVIAYRCTSRTVTIVRVLHGARDFREVLESRRPDGS